MKMGKKIPPRMWVKMMVALAATITGMATSHAEVVAYDDLEDATPGTLAGQTNGTGFTAGYIFGSGNPTCLVTNKTLGYANGDIAVDGGTNSLFITLPNVTAAFMRTFNSQNCDELYLSYLFNTPNVDGNSGDKFLSFGFNSATGEPRAGVTHRRNAAIADYGFGIRYMGANTQLNDGTEPDRTYFIVFRMRKLTPGTGNVYNELALFIDPATVYEPEPSLVVTNNCFAAATHITARVNSLSAGDAYFLDNFCVGTTYDDVVFPNGSPVVVAPVLSPDGGIFSAGSTMVSMESATPGASIRYTVDGSTPSSTHGTLYTGPVAVTASMVMRAVAFKEGMFDSLVASAQYLAQIHWVGDGGDSNWSTPGNWLPASDPASADLVFGNTNRTADTVVNNIVDRDLTVRSLTYTNSTLFPATPTSAAWHVTEIEQGRTLTVTGAAAAENAVLVGGNTAEGQFTTSVKLTDGGRFVVDAPDSIFLLANKGANNKGTVVFDLLELDLADITVNEILIGYEQRSSTTFTLPSADAATNRLVATTLTIADSKNSSNGQSSYLHLGRNNELYADKIAIAARKDLDTGWQGANGYVSFQNLGEGAPPFVKIRGRDGVSRANMIVGYMGSISGQMGYQFTNGLLDFSGGTVDALLGDLLIGQHQARVYAQHNGGANGTLNMESGIVDALTTSLGRSIYRSDVSSFATGTLNISGGLFRTERLSLADNHGASSQNGGSARGVVNVSGTGVVEVLGDVIMGTVEAIATNLIATVAVSDNGVMRVHGNMAPGTVSDYIAANILLSGGTFCVTNAAGDAELRIERGAFELSGGAASIDRLVLTNELCTTRVVLNGTENYGHVVVNTEVLLGGALEVAYAEEFTPQAGDVWKIVDGTGTRNGEFDPERIVLPPDERLRVIYTNAGFDLAYPALTTLFILR